MMNYRLKLYIVALALGLSFAAALPAGARAGQASGAAARPGGLTEQERRGKAIYMRGESLAGRGITALIGEVDVPASTMSCAGCHGLRGEGITEGGVTAGNLTWSNLLKPYGHTHESGRKHGPFDRFTFIRATIAGLDPAGNELAAAMPRYRMSPEDLSDLIAYVERLETDRDPGLTDAAVKVAAVLPATGPLGEVGAAMRETLAAYFDELNGRGGIFSRKVEFRAIEPGADAAATVRASLRRGEVFALVGGVSAGADAELAALALEEEMPLIGPSTLLPQASRPPNRYVFYLLPGVAEQARALANFAASLPELKRPEAKPPRVFVVRPAGELAEAAEAAVADQAKVYGWTSVARKTYAAGGFDAAALAQTLKREGAGAVFFFGGGAEQAAFIREAAALGWTPHFFLLGATTGGDLLSAVPPSFKGKVFVSFPTLPSDVTPGALREFRALSEKYKLAPRHTASRLSSLAAAKTFVEGLTRAGSDVSRERLITALEGLYDYETGVTPPLIFGPNRRVGAPGAYVVTIDPETGAFALVGWVKAD